MGIGLVAWIHWTGDRSVAWMCWTEGEVSGLDVLNMG
jgi:hypothetical protein